MNYKEVDLLLQGRTKLHKKYANNTFLTRHDNYLALVYHSTEVVKFYPNGDIVLDNGGYYTSTTKERINWMLLAHPVGIFQEKGIWYLGSPANNSAYKFQPGITIKANGKIAGYANDNPKADKLLKAKVKTYAQLCADSIPLEKPDSGDCCHCYMTTEDGQSLGDACKDTSHLDDHIKEKYIVPSLVFKALKQYGNTDFILSLVFQNPEKHMLDIAKDRVKRSVYRYILSRKGYAI